VAGFPVTLFVFLGGVQRQKKLPAWRARIYCAAISSYVSFAVAVRGCGVALGCAAMASGNLMRCDFLLCVGGSRLRSAVARRAWLRGDSERGFNALRFPLMCRSRLRFNRKSKPLFFRVSSTSLPAHKSRLMRRIDRLTVSSKSGNRRENSAQDKQNWVFRRNPPVPNRN
jgi:hypothetical protein